MSKPELFLELANPDENGFSRTVHIDEFQGKYECLNFSNGLDWGRNTSSIAKKYYIKKIRSKDDKIIGIKLDGFRNDRTYYGIRKDIINEIKEKPCVITGLKINIEVDHKNGRKNDERVMNAKTQEVTDFQPLNRSINLLKRQKCKECKKTNKRFDARELGFTVGWVYGNEEYDDSIGCKGCYYYDPIEFKKLLELK